MLISLTLTSDGSTIKLDDDNIKFVQASGTGSLIQYNNGQRALQDIYVDEAPSAIVALTGAKLFSLTLFSSLTSNITISASVPFDNVSGTFLLGERVQINNSATAIISGTTVTTPLSVISFFGGEAPDNSGILGLTSGATALVNGSVTYTYGGGVTTYVNATAVSKAQFSGIASLNAVTYQAGMNIPMTFYTDMTLSALETNTDYIDPVTIGGSQTITGNKTFSGASVFSGSVTMSGLLIESSLQSISGAGAINTTTFRTNITTTGANAYTLANGTVGQIKVITMVVDGGDATITPTTLLGGTTITLDAVGDSVTLQYGVGGWAIIGGNGYVLA